MRVAFLLLALCLPAICGTILWDQSPYLPGYGIVDQEFGDMSGYSSYIVNDVNVPASGWTISSVTSYFEPRYDWSWSGATIPVRLNIFPKSGSLPGAGDDPTAGSVFDAAYSSDGNTITIVLGGLSIALSPGDYWIGFTPVADYGSHGQLFYEPAASSWGDDSGWRNPGAGFGYGGAWSSPTAIYSDWHDGSIVIEGEAGAAVPEPSTWLLMGLGVAGLAVLRKRA